MSRPIKGIVFTCVIGLVAACGGRQEEYVVVDPEPISVEPTYTGKFK